MLSDFRDPESYCCCPEAGGRAEEWSAAVGPGTSWISGRKWGQASAEMSLK